MSTPEEEFFEESFLLPSLTEEKIDKEYDFGTQDIHATTIGMIPVLAEKARHAAKSGLSFSYRGFLVGGAALAYDTDPENSRLGTYTAGNYKAKLREEERDEADVEDIPKFCAEMDIIMHASGSDFERIGIFIVSGTTNPERIQAVTPLAGATLEPCDECENVMRNNNLVDAQTIIMTMGSGEDLYQVQNFASLQYRYECLRTGADPGRLNKFVYSPTAWERRQQRYITARDAIGISPNIYERSEEQEGECRNLALMAIMSA